MQYVTRPMLKASTLLDKFIGFTFEEMDLAGDIMLKALEKELARTIACCHLFEKWPFRQKYGTSSFFKEISCYDYK